MSKQLGLDLPSSDPALERDAFFEAPCNAHALAMIDRWPDWPSRKLVVYGPSGAGKTHLAHVWASVSDGTIIDATALAQADISTLAQGSVAVENVQDIAGKDDAETALFHLHNLTLANGNSLLLTGRNTLGEWGLTLPDLVSRLAGTTSIAIAEPDDTLLGMLLAKLLYDRQLRTKPDLIPFLLRRMDRSFEAAITLTGALDAASLAGKRPITRALAAEVFDTLDNDASTGDS